MIILFSDIYKKAIALFDDPEITEAYNMSEVIFCKRMYTYLQNSISAFDNPSEISIELSNFVSPKGTTEIFDADGINSSFVISEDFLIEPYSIYQYKESTVFVHGEFDPNTRTVIFPNVLEVGKKYYFEQYSVGYFNLDLSNLTNDTSTQRMLAVQIKDILARLLIKSWGEETRNFLLDIQNILTDSDFKLKSGASALRAKNEWMKQLDLEVSQFKNKMAWVLKYCKMKRG